MAICDHSKSLKIAHGLDESRLTQQIEEIDRINENIERHFESSKGLRSISSAMEGWTSPDKILEKLDLVIASIHSGFKQDREKMTKRIIRALENPWSMSLPILPAGS